ncbi:MAG TPA: GIY-YIG nuclease family protein [Armatimonadota bacterium]|nr:GIY-YIG nuclease family protein [Armatimonadota bacterium]
MGVYWMKDRRGRILYVGKAVNLRSRLRSHLRATGRNRQKVQRHLYRVRDIQWFAAPTEAEALALEESLIRENQPPFNIVRPRYRFLRLTTGEPYPRLEIVREMKVDDGARYFGPYPDTAALERLFQSILPLFRIRGSHERCAWDGETPRAPCHHHEFGWCSAPCAAMISPEAYLRDALALERLLRGSDREIMDSLAEAAVGRLNAAVEERERIAAAEVEIRRSMTEASSRLDYEEAAALRDRLGALERQVVGADRLVRRLRKQRSGLGRAAETPHVVQPQLPDLDVWCIATAGVNKAIAILPYRAGRLCVGASAVGPLAVLIDRVRAHYRSVTPPPPIVVWTADDGETNDASGAKLLKVIWDETLARVDSPLRPRYQSALDDRCWKAAAEIASLNARSALAGDQRRSKSRANLSGRASE